MIGQMGFCQPMASTDVKTAPGLCGRWADETLNAGPVEPARLAATDCSAPAEGWGQGRAQAKAPLGIA